MEELARLLEARCEGRVLKNEPMAGHTTFRVGGPADLCFFPETEEEVAFALAEAQRLSVPAFVMGNGSNLVVRDGGIRGLVAILGERFSRIEAEGTRVTAQAGATLARVAAFALDRSLAGFEFASGIPGTIGGGAAMNAGAYGGQISDVFFSARVLKDGAISTYTLSDMEMCYRSTRVLREGSIVLSVELALRPGDAAEIRATMNDFNGRRREKQPLEYPSAGSTFKRPEGYFAGALIDQAGLRGARVGGAMVSEKHAGFIVNVGGATARDILALIDLVEARVRASSGVALEPEVRIVGEE
jgi:UDP-N-acetylmuramate dehydrogenase